SGCRHRGLPGGPISSRTPTPATRAGPPPCRASRLRSCSPRRRACSCRGKMSPVRVAVVGNLSLDLVDGGPPRPGGPPLYAGRALAALGVPALVCAKCAQRDRGRLLPALQALELPIELRDGKSTAKYTFSYDGDR